MKKNKILNFIVPILLVGAISFVLLSNRRKYDPRPGNGGGSNVPDKSITVYLNSISGLPRPANIRNYPCPATPYLGMGSDNNATSLNDTPFMKFYCVVTVTNLANSSWGSNGKKATVWNTRDIQKSIAVPGNGSYKVTVDYYEQYNQYWTNTVSAARGKWTTERTFTSGESGNRSFGNFTFVQQLF
ncbi:hypothetical protein CMU00_15960 [Elizabethkingia anophelis]|nr:hypothetical protein [Elizabethkingia anophelis]